MIGRVLEPEWLDELPASEPDAIGSRRDLHRLNGLMGHAAIIARALRSLPTPRRVLDLGAGDGTFALRLAKAAGWRDVHFALLDRVDIVPSTVREAFELLDCRVTTLQRDVLDSLGDVEMPDCIIANLFLHHFNEEQLARLLNQAAAHCITFVACEPRRSVFALLASRLVGAIGCNAVTRHDAVASVRAGFRDKEISRLWPQRGAWSFAECGAGFFSHLFVARRL